MPLCNMVSLLQRAEHGGYAVGAFNVGSMEMIRGAIRAAEERNTPIILQVAETRLSHAPFYLIAPMMVSAASAARVDVAVHLDHGRTLDIIRAAISTGFTSVMFDGSHLPYEENIAQTAQVASLAHHAGLDVEGELGVIGGREGGSLSRTAACTNPNDVPDFTSHTGVDALAVACGNAHGSYTSAPVLRFDILECTHGITPVPLVLHGGTGLKAGDFRRAARCGVRKINVATASFQNTLKMAEDYCSTEPPRDFFSLSEQMVLGAYQTVREYLNYFSRE